MPSKATGPSGYEWSFVALEYYSLILNRTYKVFVADGALCGAIVRGWLASPPVVHAQHYDPEFYPRKRILRRYAGIDVHSSEFANKNYWNFQLRRADLADVEFSSDAKWGMANIPYSGRIILYFRQGGSRELILLGVQDGPGIRDCLRPQVVGAHLPWWHRWLPTHDGALQPERG